MVIRYKDKDLVVIDRARVLKAENYIDAIINSPSRGTIFSRIGVDGREMCIELPVYLDEIEREYLIALYRSYGWQGVECETLSKRKQNFILKL